MSATIVKLTHKNAFGVGELQKYVDLLDDFRLGMLIVTARNLALEVPKKTNATIHQIREK